MTSSETLKLPRGAAEKCCWSEFSSLSVIIFAFGRDARSRREKLMFPSVHHHFQSSTGTAVWVVSERSDITCVGCFIACSVRSGVSKWTNPDADEQRGIVEGDADAERFISGRTKQMASFTHPLLKKLISGETTFFLILSHESTFYYENTTFRAQNSPFSSKIHCIGNTLQNVLVVSYIIKSIGGDKWQMYQCIIESFIQAVRSEYASLRKDTWLAVWVSYQWTDLFKTLIHSRTLWCCLERFSCSFHFACKNLRQQ